MTDLEGGCACGAVRYRLKDAPLIVHCCHCLDCQRLTGSAFVLNAWIEAERVEVLSGELTVSHLKGGSGRPHDVFSCAQCGTTVWSAYGGEASPFRFVRIGTLDRPDALSPDVHIHTRSKQLWLRLSGDVPVYEDYYEKADVWPADSIRRFNEALGKA